MKGNKRVFQIIIMILIGVALNYGGRILALHFNLPLWLDSFGTMACAYAFGPVPGAIAGVASSILVGALDNTALMAYGIAGAVIGIVVGIASRKKMMDTVLGTMTVSVVVTFFALLITVPINMIFFEGSTNNMWGEGVRMFLLENNWPGILCDIIGQAYLEFLDKFITLILLYLVIRIFRLFRKKPAQIAESAAIVLIVLLVSASFLRTASAAALDAASSGNSDTVSKSASRGAGLDYSDYVQTVYASANGLPCGEANDIAQTNDGILWVGTYAGLYRYNGKEFKHMDEYPSVRNVNCLFVDPDGRLFIGTNDNGLSVAENEEIVFIKDEENGLPSNSVRSVIISTDRYYYVGTTGSMQVFTIGKDLEEVCTLSEINYADDICADTDGHVAAITSDGHLFLLKEGKILDSLQLNEGSEAFKSGCFEKDGTLLVGTNGSTIIRFDISSGRFEEAGRMTCEGLSNIKDISLLSTDEHFLSADNGIGYLDTEMDFHLINTNDFNTSIDNMLMDYQGNLWFASSRLGLLRMAPSAFKDIYATVGLNSKVVNTIVKWQGDYYVGNDKGLDIIDEDCRNHITNELSGELDGVRIRCMLVDSRDALWICTYGRGLIEVEADGTEHLYNHENGSFGDWTRLVYELSDGTILAGSDTGVCFIQDHDVIGTIGYSVGQINSMILTATEMPDGTILIGTDGDGIAVVRDGHIEKMLARSDGLSSEIILRTIPDTKSDGVYIVTSNGLCFMEEDGSIRTLDKFPYYNNYNIWARDKDTLFVLSSAGIYVVDRDELLSEGDSLSYDLLDSHRGLNSSLTANSWLYYDEEKEVLFLPCDTGTFAMSPSGYDDLDRPYHMQIAAVRLDEENVKYDHNGQIRVPRSVSRLELLPEIINYTIQNPYAGYYLEGFDSRWTIVAQSNLNSIIYTNLSPGAYKLHLAVFDNNQTDIIAQRSFSIYKEKAIYDNDWFIAYMIIVPMIAAMWLTWFLVQLRMKRRMEAQERELAMARKQVEMGNQTILAIARTVDAKDGRTSQHSWRVSHYAVLIAKTMGLDEHECENIRRAALLHDIGKIGIPDSVLNKPSKLTDEEYALMKSHVNRGADILKDFTLISNAADGARFHHERYDGRGYPNGLKGEDIPFYGRIIGVADAFDAMTSNRIYRQQMDFDYVIGELKKGRGTQFDPQITDAFLKLLEDGTIDLNKLYHVEAAAITGTEPKENSSSEE